MSPAEEDGRSSRPLVIGVGNEMRGDDAAGLRVTRELRTLVGDRVGFAEVPGEVSDLLDLWEGRERVYVIDAVRSGGAPGSWVRIVVGDRSLPASTTGTSTHGLSIASAVALGQILGRMPGHLVIYGIEASQFDPGSELSPEVLDGVHKVTRALTEELENSASGRHDPRRD